MSHQTYRGRIAPSPTGYLHLGHAKTFWSAYTRCRQAEGILIYRDEDIDPHRCKEIYSTAAMEDLQKLGLTWDEGPIYQSQRIPLYEAALKKLIELGLAYPCQASRKGIREHPETRQASNGEVIFPTALRCKVPKSFSTHGLYSNWRFKVPHDRVLAFRDQQLGSQAFQAQKDFGDFLVWRKEGVPAYELAVVVDDIDMNISEVVRGEDLLVSTARQLLIYEALGSPPPKFFHELLVKDEAGTRLAKRKDSLSLRTLFAQGHNLDSLQAMWMARS